MNRFVELRFEPVRREHHGNYTCVAKNLADITSTIATLAVECKNEKLSEIRFALCCSSQIDLFSLGKTCLSSSAFRTIAVS